MTIIVSEVFAIVQDWKNYQRKLQRVKTILGTSRSRMHQLNAGSTRAKFWLGFVPLCKPHLVTALCLYYMREGWVCGGNGGPSRKLQ